MNHSPFSLSSNISQWLDRHALLSAIVIGAIGYPVFRYLTPALPYLIFTMLFFTFCKVNPLDLRLHPWHWIALTVQLSLAIGVYYILILSGVSSIVAQSVMLCLIMPTATAAPIIAGKLGGSIQNLTTFTLLSNFATAIVVPLFFPVVHPMLDMNFMSAMLLIMKKVSPLLLGPFFTAWLIRICYDMRQKRLKTGRTFYLNRTLAQIPFYVWAVTIIILMAGMTDTLVNGQYSFWTVVWILLGAIVTCFIQFILGWQIGYRWPASSHGTDYHDVVINPEKAPKTPSGISRVTAGQAMGQKNTTLAIWMAQTYLIPLTALGPALYMIVQNLFNAWQLKRAAKSINVPKTGDK